MSWIGGRFSISGRCLRSINIVWETEGRREGKAPIKARCSVPTCDAWTWLHPFLTARPSPRGGERGAGRRPHELLGPSRLDPAVRAAPLRRRKGGPRSGSNSGSSDARAASLPPPPPPGPQRPPAGPRTPREQLRLRPPPPPSRPLGPGPTGGGPGRPGATSGPGPAGEAGARTPGSRAAPSRPPKRRGRRAPAAETPRILYRGKSGAPSKMGRQGWGGAGAAGRSMQRSQSRSSLSASFEALAGYFPCMNSLEEEEEEGEPGVGVSVCLPLEPRGVGVGGVAGERTVRSRVPAPPIWGTVMGRGTPERATWAKLWPLAIWRAAGCRWSGLAKCLGVEWGCVLGVLPALFLFTVILVFAFSPEDGNAQKTKGSSKTLQQESQDGQVKLTPPQAVCAVETWKFDHRAHSTVALTTGCGALAFERCLYN